MSSCYAGTVWNSMNVMFNPTPSRGWMVFVSGKPVVYITG